MSPSRLDGRSSEEARARDRATALAERHGYHGEFEGYHSVSPSAYHGRRGYSSPSRLDGRSSEEARERDAAIAAAERRNALGEFAGYHGTRSPSAYHGYHGYTSPSRLDGRSSEEARARDRATALAERHGYHGEFEGYHGGRSPSAYHGARSPSAYHGARSPSAYHGWKSPSAYLEDGRSTPEARARDRAIALAEKRVRGKFAGYP